MRPQLDSRWGLVALGAPDFLPVPEPILVPAVRVPAQKRGRRVPGEEPAPYVRLLGEEGGTGVDKQATVYIARVLSVHQQFGGG
jgi:hypothetical protein